jgi:hypothetical protein
MDALPAPFSALLSNGLGLLTVLRLPWLHHMPSSADLTMETKPYALL